MCRGEPGRWSCHRDILDGKGIRLTTEGRFVSGDTGGRGGGLRGTLTRDGFSGRCGRTFPKGGWKMGLSWGNTAIGSCGNINNPEGN